jgi:hypothetical protein
MATYGRMWPPVKPVTQKTRPSSSVSRTGRPAWKSPWFLPILDASASAMASMPRSTISIPRLSLPLGILAGLAIIAVTAGVLYAMGRIPMCKCGYIKLWHGGRADSEMSQHLTDWYTYSHVLHGIIFYWLLTILAKGRVSIAARLVLAMVIEAGWEILENTPLIIERYRAQTISRDYYGDSIVNVVGDMLATLVGFLLAARLPAWVTVVLLIAVEVTLLFVIGDNLTLNIIMLLYPVEWIRQWQLGR